MGTQTPVKSEPKPAAKKPGVGSRTRFLTVNKFRVDRVGKWVVSGIAAIVIAAAIWCIFYFVS